MTIAGWWLMEMWRLATCGHGLRRSSHYYNSVSRPFIQVNLCQTVPPRSDPRQVVVLFFSLLKLVKFYFLFFSYLLLVLSLQWITIIKGPPRITGMVFLWAGCPSCHPTISVKALKGIQSTDRNQWPDLIVSTSTTGLLTDGALLWP